MRVALTIPRWAIGAPELGPPPGLLGPKPTMEGHCQ